MSMGWICSMKGLYEEQKNLFMLMFLLFCGGMPSSQSYT